MKLSEVIDLVGNVPHMTPKQGTVIYNMIIDNDINEILELGTAHGTGSCFMAAALEEKGKGQVMTIDNKLALGRSPNVMELLSKCNLSQFVNPVFAHTTYNWELMKIIEENTEKGTCRPIFDFCYLDGSHNFEIDSAAFILVDKLLKPGGFILFDDLNWTFGNCPDLKDKEWVKKMSEEEKNTPHIKKLVEVLVLNHPNYYNFNLSGDWFLAQKKSENNKRPVNPIDLEMYRTNVTVGKDIHKIVKRIKNKISLTLKKSFKASLI